MAAEPAGGPQAAPAPDAPRIVITFAGRGSSTCTIIAPGIDTGQLYLAAWLLDAMAHEARGGEVLQAQQAAIPNLAEVMAALRKGH